MIVYKGMNPDMTCTKGKGAFRYKLGETVKEGCSKTARKGLHCTENPFLVLGWYGLGKGNRYFLCEASGSIDEDRGDDKIACTELTVKKELTVKELAGHGMMYMVSHPLRDWKQKGNMLEIAADRAEAFCAGAIAIARGENPMARGAEGSYLGLVRENAGLIEEARLLTVEGDIRPGVWYTLDNGVKEVRA